MTASTLFRLYSFTLVTVLAFLFSCKKNDNNYTLKGKISEAINGGAATGVTISIEQQELSSGSISSYWNSATSGTSDASGNYSVSWERKNVNGLRAVLSLDNYFPQTIDLNPDDLRVGEENERNFTLYSKAILRTEYINGGSASASDLVSFRFINTQFNCNCCNNNEQIIQGIENVTQECSLYGNSWVRYQAEIESSDMSTFLYDSIYCPAFITTTLQIQY